MIYDCFTYFNTPDILKLRLAELADYVDWFVLVECPVTFSGLPKPLYYKENPITGYKIRHVISTPAYEGPTDETGAWRNTEAQVKGYGEGTFDANPSDILLLSDVDEIPRPSRLLAGDTEQAAIFEQRWYMYWLQYYHPQLHYGTTRVHYHPDINWYSAAMYRWAPDKNIIPDGGWHFSYFGGENIIREKLAGHHDAGLPRALNLERSIMSGGELRIGEYHPPADAAAKMGIPDIIPCEVDSTYPNEILKHPEKYQGLFHPDHRSK